MISAVLLNKISLHPVRGWIGPQPSASGTEVKSTFRSHAPTPDAREAHARVPLLQSSSGRGYRLAALALVGVLALAGCGTSGGSTTAATSSTKAVKDQPEGKRQRQECELAAKEIDRTELEHVKEVVSPESSEGRELDMRVAERKATAISKCR
jgi:hypothetical protein